MSEISKTMQLICAEKGLAPEVVLEAIEAALGAAYRKDFGNRQQNIKVKFDIETSDMQVWDVKEVVEDIAPEALEMAQEELTKRRDAAKASGRELTEEDTADLPHFNPKNQIMLTEAKAIKKDAKVGDILEIVLPVPGDFGRMAAQTAKQVIIQKLREAERTMVFGDFKEQMGQIVQGIVQRRDRSGNVTIDLGKITGIVPQTEQIQGEQYRPGTRMRFYVSSVAMGERGPEIVLSRSHKDMVKTIFTHEIPEIADGSVTISGIARDAGHRSKVAVTTSDDNIDPIGACIGQRGSRITTIIEQLGGEKIDIIQYSDSPAEFIKHALSPAKVSNVTLDESTKRATALVPADQFSLAIGRGGQNVRLASALTGWNIDVVEEKTGEPLAIDPVDDETTEAAPEPASTETPAEESPEKAAE